MNNVIQELFDRYSHEAQTNKSVRRREAYQQAADQLKRVLDDKQSLRYVRSLYYDFMMFEHNPTKRQVVQQVYDDISPYA